jgi:hypothetical protein
VIVRGRVHAGAKPPKLPAHARLRRRNLHDAKQLSRGLCQ